MDQLRQIGNEKDIQGESPVWCAREQALYWVDTRSRLVRRLDHASGQINSWKLPGLTCSIVIRDAGGLLVAMQNAIVLFDARTGEVLERINAPHAPEAGMRFADGRCDRRGRFWVGAKHDASSAPIGFLYRFDPDHSFTAMETGVAMPNSLAWSPDNRSMYFADAAVRTIFTYSFDIEHGTIAARKPFAICDWSPDGAAMDSEGYLWNAGYRGWRVTRYAPDGRVDREIKLPVSLVTACTFGGPNMQTLYITTARQKMTEEALAEQPLAGALFAIDAGVRGLEEPRYAG